MKELANKENPRINSWCQTRRLCKYKPDNGCQTGSDPSLVSHLHDALNKCHQYQGTTAIVANTSLQALSSSFCQKSASAIIFYPVACSGNTLVTKVRDAQLWIEWMDRCSVSKCAFPENCKMLTSF